MSVEFKEMQMEFTEFFTENCGPNSCIVIDQDFCKQLELEKEMMQTS